LKCFAEQRVTAKRNTKKASMVLNHDTSCQKNKDIEYCASFVNSKCVLESEKMGGWALFFKFLQNTFFLVGLI